MQHTVHIHPDPQSLTLAAAQRWLALARQSIAARGQFHVALSGGSTPQALYETLARPEFAQEVDWGAVHVYFGDERAVPPTHPDNNYRMAELALLRHVPIPPGQIHRMAADDPANIQENAAAYERELRAALPRDPDEMPVFDLILLGLGPDGHIASLFPGTAALHERERLVTAVYVEKFQAWRMTLTFPIIDRARHLMPLVSGRGKAEVVRQVLGTRDPGPEPLPVQRLRPAGTLEWHLDAAAAELLPPKARS
ncbi:MAG: 6-phosphogluconolactonase [Gammaproteobacteria bacterium]